MFASLLLRVLEYFHVIAPSQAEMKAQAEPLQSRAPSPLDRLSMLRASGALREEEYQSLRELCLRNAATLASSAPPYVDELACLHDLVRRGALSESEFNLRKWEILAKS